MSAALGKVRDDAAWLYANAEANKVAIGGVGAAAGAAIHSIAAGADSTTLLLAVVALFAAITHLTVTPLSRPRAADGTKLEPVTRLTLLPAVTAMQIGPLPPVGRRLLGHIRSPRDDRDHRYSATTKIPATIHRALGLVFTALGNLQVGDCAPAGWEHMLQVLDSWLGRQPIDPTTDQTIALYSAVTGYKPGDASTDRGTVLRDMLKYLRAQGLITAYAAVSLDATSLKSAIATHGAVLCGFALPTGAETEGVKWRVPRAGREAGSWGGHCVPLVGYTTETFDLVSWGEAGTASLGFVGEYLDEAWVVELPAA